jgi:hypothetical protein
MAGVWTQAEILCEAHCYEGACFSADEAGGVAADTLTWVQEDTFILSRLAGFTAGDYNHLAQDYAEREMGDEYALYVAETHRAIVDGTIDPLVAAQGRDGRFYVWDGNHRTGMASVLGVPSMPALVGYQKRGN